MTQFLEFGAMCGFGAMCSFGAVSEFGAVCSFGGMCGFGAGDVGSKFGAFVRYFVPR